MGVSAVEVYRDLFDIVIKQPSVCFYSADVPLVILLAVFLRLLCFVIFCAVVFLLSVYSGN